MKSTTGDSSAGFREAFCRRYGCNAARYEKAVLRRSFPLLATPLGWLVLAVRPSVFQRELSLLGRIAGNTSESGLRGELDGYVYENGRDRPFRVQMLGLRLSRRRFLRVYRAVMGAPMV